MTEKVRMITETQYQFYKKMLDAVQSFYDWAKENEDEPREYVQWAYGGVTNDTGDAIEYAFDEGLVE